MKSKKTRVSVFIMIAILMMSVFTGCGALDTIKEAWNASDNYVKRYDDGLKNIDYYDGSDLDTFQTTPELFWATEIDLNAEQSEGKTVDSFGNEILIITAPSVKGNGEVAYINVELKSGTYNKDRLDCILSDIREIRKKYKSYSKVIVVFRNSGAYIEWFTIHKNENKSDDTIICREDYIDYIKCAYDKYFSVENNEYYYSCQLPEEVYEIDIKKAFKDTQFSSGDLQIKYKSEMNSDIINCLDYWTVMFQFRYEVYPDSEEDSLTVIMYPDEGENDKDNMIEFFSELRVFMEENYKHYTIIREISKNGKVIHDIRDGEVQICKLSKY
ncbi:MAG: hypothetical protein NC177_10330 [Ruminococcus flavefaciens]|nr:hypothetical protein [Ruminococcus flavefaciens]